MAQAIRKSSLEGKLEIEVEIKSPAEKYFSLFIENPQEVFPKATPNCVQGCDLDTGKFVKVGSTYTWDLVIDGQPHAMKERVDAMEKDKYWLSTSVVGGDALKEFKNLSFIWQVIPKKNGHGGVAKCIAKYEKIDENVAHPENMLSMFVNILKDMDAMLFSQV